MNGNRQVPKSSAGRNIGLTGFFRLRRISSRRLNGWALSDLLADVLEESASAADRWQHERQKIYLRNLNLHQAVETPADPKPIRALVLSRSLPSFMAQAMARGTDAETVFPKRLWVL